MESKLKSILLTGGCGYIGSHTCYQLLQSFPSYSIIIVDNLSNSDLSNFHSLQLKFPHSPISLYSFDLSHYEKLKEVFKENKIEGVIHFAGLKAVGESCEKPYEYYSNNLISTLNLIRVMKEFKCQNLIFSSSATVYGMPQYVPIDEGHPLSALNPYGRTKLMIEEILKDIHSSGDEMNIILLRYFNPISCHPSGLLKENPLGRPNNLFPIISRVYQGIYPVLTIFGDDYETKDGTGVRDYIHVVDLSEAHVLSLQYLFEKNEKSILKIYNVGTGNGISVMEMIKKFEELGGEKINYKIVERRRGDAGTCYADSKKIEEELGWRAKYGLDEMVQHELERIWMENKNKNE